MSKMASEETERFLADGYIILTGLLDNGGVVRAQEEIWRYMPSWEEYARAPAKFPSLDVQGTSAGSAAGAVPI